MKCPCCGSKINLYNETKHLLDEMGVNKESLQEQITQTINSVVNNAVKENLDKKIENSIKGVISEQRYVIKDAIMKGTEEFLANKLEVTLKKEG
jgi:hypothetical protein